MDTSEARTTNMFLVAAYYGLGASELHQRFAVYFTFGG
jgi:hypothetical protein